MEPIAGHWLDPETAELARTPELGVRLEGVSEQRPNSKAAACPDCGGPLALVATYENSAFIHLSKFALVTLEVCPACSAESDGSPGGNGFTPLLRQAGEGVAPPAFTDPVYFHATATGEPASGEEFRRWHPRTMRGKLGGHQLSIQPPLEARCEKCSGPLLFVASVDERWGRSVLNFGGGFGYLFVCSAECSPDSALFYWDCD